VKIINYSHQSEIHDDCRNVRIHGLSKKCMDQEVDFNGEISVEMPLPPSPKTAI